MDPQGSSTGASCLLASDVGDIAGLVAAIAGVVGVLLVWLQLRALVAQLRMQSFLALRQSLTRLNELIMEHPRSAGGALGESGRVAFMDNLIAYFETAFLLHREGGLEPVLMQAERNFLRESLQDPKVREHFQKRMRTEAGSPPSQPIYHPGFVAEVERMMPPARSS